MLGTIKMMKPESGFGFITPEIGKMDLFFHFSKVEGGDGTFKYLRSGDSVEFDIEDGIKRPQAVNVRPIMNMETNDNLINDNKELLVEDEYSSREQGVSRDDLSEKVTIELNAKFIESISTKVNKNAQNLLYANSPLLEGFTNGAYAFVISIDIRRSTELMQKAKDDKRFAIFLSKINTGLKNIIFNNYGVFDKFTGDGALGCFPLFYSGPDAGFFALKAAHECHELFSKIYAQMRPIFSSILIDTGFGIGIDFGKIEFVNIGEELFISGRPIVYACRMGGAPSGKTYLNQSAYELVQKDYGAYCFFEEQALAVKHDGDLLAYSASLIINNFIYRRPDWA